MLSVGLAFYLSADRVTDLLSVPWWLKYTLAEYERNPYSIMLEYGSFVLILLVLLIPQRRVDKDAELTTSEEDQIIAHWKPQNLVPDDFAASEVKEVVVQGAAGRTVRIGDRDVLNFSSHNYLGLVERKEVLDVALLAIDKYGVGSCGPRGFYGSFDVHIELENKMAEFYGAEHAILYSDAIACISSVIPAFAKSGDTVFYDESCHYGVQVGLNLCRAKCVPYRHNDMAHLEELLAGVRPAGNSPSDRRMIITEGVFQNIGDICHLDKVHALAKEFKFRIMLDDSYGIGVLGATGRGTCEHFGLKPVEDVDVIVVGLDTTLASSGGVCVGPYDVVDHQRLSGAGYVYSASGPPFTSVAATAALDIIIKEGKTLVGKLRNNSERMHAGLNQQDGIKVVSSPMSPLIHFRLTSLYAGKEEKALLKICEHMMFKGVCIRRPQDIQRYKAKQPAGLCIEVSSLHTTADIDKCLTLLGVALQKAL